MSAKSIRVLVVDPDRVVGSIVRRSLADGDAYSIDCATNVDQARKRITDAAAGYDVALICETLPQRPRSRSAAEGLDLLKKLKARSPSTEILFLTTNGHSSALAALRAGAFHYLEKPLSDPAEVAIFIERAAELHRLRALVGNGQATRPADAAPATDVDKSDDRPVWDTARLLDAVRSTNLAISTFADRTAHLQTIVEQAVTLLGSKTAGVYRYDRERGELTLIADSLGEDKRGRTLKVGEGLSGRLVEERVPYLIVENYDEWPHRSASYAKGSFGAVLGVPVLWQGEIVGTLYVNDEVGRPYSPEDADALALLAQQVAIALDNADLLTEREEKLARFEKLSNATREIMADLTKTPLEDRLTLIAQHATQILDAEACGVSLVEEPAVLTLVAGYGYPDDTFPKGLKLPIRKGEGMGLSGHIAAEGRLFNAHADELRNHLAVSKRDPASPRECNSLLAIPLLREQPEREFDPVKDVVGLLRVENKLGRDGRSRPALRFSKEDEWILEIFAKQLVVAIDCANLVDQLKEEKDYKDGLIRSSPSGLITIDNSGKVIEFNAQAERMLGYEADKARGMSVRDIYWEPETPKHIGAALDEADGIVKDYNTFLRHRAGDRIPIRLSAIWLYDARKTRIGSAGFFEDLRGIQRLKERQRVLLQAGQVVVEAKLKEGLRKLAAMMLDLLPHTFCRILISREGRESLVVEAAHHTAETREESCWRPRIDSEIKFDEWPGLKEVLERDRPTLLRLSSHQEFLQQLSKNLELSSPIHSLLLVPLKIGEHVVGLLEVGEIGEDAEHPIAVPEQDLAVGIAGHTAVLIDRLRLHQITERRKRLADAVTEVMVLGETENTLQLVANSTLAGVDCDAVTLYPYDAASGKLIQPPKQAGLKHARRILAKYDATDSLVVQEVLSQGRPVLIEDAANDPRTKDTPFTVVEGIASFIAVPLRTGGKSVGVMCVSYRSRHRFSDAELSSIHLFSNHAAIAINNAQQHELTTAHKENLQALHNAAQAMASAVGLKAVRQAIAEEARKLFGASTTVLWPYDARRKEFLLEQPAAAGLSCEILERAKKLRAEPGHSRHTILEQGWIGKEDVYSEELPYLTKPGRIIMQSAGLCGFQGIALKVAEEPVGVLLFGYVNRHSFSDKERKNLENFASYAALILKRSRLFDQVIRSDLIAKIVGKVSTVGELEGALLAVATMTPEVAHCDKVRLYIRDPIGAGFSCYSLKEVKRTGKSHLVSEPVENPDAIRGFLDREDSILICDRTSEAPAACSYIATEVAGFAAWVAIAMKVAGHAVGVFFVGYKQPQHFMIHEIDSIGLLAHQTAIAVANNQLFRQSEKKSVALRALYNAGSAIAQASLDLDHTLDQIATQALGIVGIRPKERGSFSYVALLEDNAFELIAAHPHSRLRMLRRELTPERWSQESQDGISGRAVQRKLPMNVGDVNDDDDYIEFTAITRSQLTVPILFKNKVIGFVTIEKPMLHAFSGEDVQNVELLAAQAAVAIQNARQYTELKKTRGMVGARTALAWMGMMAASWRHDIESDAVSIRGEAGLLLRRELSSFSGSASAEKRLLKIQRLAGRICERPVTPPLSSSEGVSGLRLNQLVRDWIKRLWATEVFQSIDKQLVLDLPEDATIVANAKWLRRAFDYLLNNAAKAVGELRKGKITVSTSEKSGEAIISIQDNGQGIPSEIREIIFRGPIDKIAGEKGLGFGILMAQVIVQAYKGDVTCAKTGRGGTTMITSLPLEKMRQED